MHVEEARFRDAADKGEREGILPRYIANARHMADDAHRLSEYLDTNADSEQAELVRKNFPVAYGIDISQYSINGWPRFRPPGGESKVIDAIAPGDIHGEFMVWGQRVAPDAIGVIAVPASRVVEVADMVHRAGQSISVISLEALTGLPSEHFEGRPAERQAKAAYSEASASKRIGSWFELARKTLGRLVFLRRLR